MQNNLDQYSAPLCRRGFDLGAAPVDNPTNDTLENWQQGKPILLKNQCRHELPQYQQAIQQAHQLYQAVLSNEQHCEDLLDHPPYIERLNKQFESLGSSINEGDDQEIETVLFDVINNGDIIAEDLWMKVSWLSFHPEDASLRFRFSFGVDLHEDVAADKPRQHYAAQLCHAIFPESELITQNTSLLADLANVLACQDIHFVERIVYFNAPQGGAYLHHDRERGHAGVIYAQLSGQTIWLALPRASLLDEIILFIQSCHQSTWPTSLTTSTQQTLLALSQDRQLLTHELESFNHTALIHLINETAEFTQQLIRHGHSRTVQTGDMLLLPQETAEHCCWHSVFNIEETAGEALSFAIRRA